MRYIRIFSELTNQLRYSTQKRVLIELAVVKLCKPQMENNFESVLNRLAVLEDMMERGVAAAPGADGRGDGENSGRTGSSKSVAGPGGGRGSRCGPVGQNYQRTGNEYDDDA